MAFEMHNEACAGSYQEAVLYVQVKTIMVDTRARQR